MSAAHKFIIGGLLVCGLGFPQKSFGISGCNNGHNSGSLAIEPNSTDSLTGTIVIQ